MFDLARFRDLRDRAALDEYAERLKTLHDELPAAQERFPYAVEEWRKRRVRYLEVIEDARKTAKAAEPGVENRVAEWVLDSLESMYQCEFKAAGRLLTVRADIERLTRQRNILLASVELRQRGIEVDNLTILMDGFMFFSVCDSGWVERELNALGFRLTRVAVVLGRAAAAYYFTSGLEESEAAAERERVVEESEGITAETD